jgi:hypothetical protein
MSRTFCKFADHIFVEGKCTVCPMLEIHAELVPDEPLPLTVKEMQWGYKVAYFRRHPCTDRFRIIPIGEAVEMGLETEGYEQHREWNNALYDFKDESKPVFLGVDGGEPEDQTFYRDLEWLIQLLNQVAKEK